MSDTNEPPTRIAGYIPVAPSGGYGHLLAPINCPHCGAPPELHKLENYDPLWRDGDVICTACHKRVRGYDAG